MYIDNQTVVYGCIKKWSSSAWVMRLIYEIAILAAKYNIWIEAHYINTAVNAQADALSRFKFEEFHHFNKLWGFRSDKYCTTTRYYSEFKFAEADTSTDKTELKRFINYINSPPQFRGNRWWIKGFEHLVFV